MQNWTETLLSQYANSPTLYSIINSLNYAIDPASDIANLYSNTWNVKTAVGKGLDNIGAIVGVNRYLQVAVTPTYFGFHEAYTIPTQATGVQPFGQAPMFNGPLANQTYTLGDSDYRTLIMAKAAANISNLTAQNINKILNSIYSGSGRVYVQDTGSMQQRYVFEFQPTPVQLAIITNAAVIPRPAGVKTYALIYPRGATFGFFEGGGVPFGSGTLFPTSGLTNAA